MTPEKIIGRIVLVLLLALAGFLAYQKVKDHFAEFESLKTYKQQAEQIGQGTAGAIDTAGKKADEVGKVEVVITDRRATAERQFEDLKNEDADVRAWADQPIPVRVREAERARRAALDGLADAASGGADSGAATPSGGDDQTP